VIKTNYPISNLRWSTTLFKDKSNLIVSLTLTSGCGYLMVLPSLVTMYGILFAPTFFATTLQSLNFASSAFKDFKTNLPLVSNKTLKFS